MQNRKFSLIKKNSIGRSKCFFIIGHNTNDRDSETWLCITVDLFLIFPFSVGL